MKSFKSACSASITEAHYHRNVVRETMDHVKAVLNKDKTLSAEGKAQRLFEARAYLVKALDHVTTALASTPEGRTLLVEDAPVTLKQTNIESLQENTVASEESDTPFVEVARPVVTSGDLEGLFAAKHANREGVNVH